MTMSLSEIHRKHLRDPQVAAGYLNEALQEGDAAFIQMALREIAEAQADSAVTPSPARPEHEDLDELPGQADCFGAVSFTKAVQKLGLSLRVDA